MSNTASREEAAFLERFGAIYEESEWVAAGAWRALAPEQRDDLELIAAAMQDIVTAAGTERQLALLRAHPDLAGRAAMADELTDASRSEQAGAGLDQCSPAEFEAFQTLNAAYREKFGFPFIIAVAGLDRRAILGAFRERVENDYDSEFATALEQVHRIAGIRLGQLQGNDG